MCDPFFAPSRPVDTTRVAYLFVVPPTTITRLKSHAYPAFLCRAASAASNLRIFPSSRPRTRVRAANPRPCPAHATVIAFIRAIIPPNSRTRAHSRHSHASTARCVWIALEPTWRLVSRLSPRVSRVAGVTHVKRGRQTRARAVCVDLMRQSRGVGRQSRAARCDTALTLASHPWSWGVDGTSYWRRSMAV